MNSDIEAGGSKLKLGNKEFQFAFLLRNPHIADTLLMMAFDLSLALYYGTAINASDDLIADVLDPNASACTRKWDKWGLANDGEFGYIRFIWQFQNL